jgi:hypothetical protein
LKMLVTLSIIRRCLKFDNTINGNKWGQRLRDTPLIRIITDLEAVEENGVSLTGLSRTSDLYGYWKCHYNVGNIIDHATTTFVNPFTSDSHRKR